MGTVTLLLLATFFGGYAAITLEHPLRINKAASSLVTGTLCWTIFVLSKTDKHSVIGLLEHQMGELSGILFFLLGAMVIVELIDAHDGFEIITSRIRTTNKRTLLWALAFLSFFLSALLDNLTTTIVVITLLRKLIEDKEERLLFVGLTVIAANAGGAWSPMGDVTTTMLWIGGQISVIPTITSLLIPSLVCLLVPTWILSSTLHGEFSSPTRSAEAPFTSSNFERNAVLGLGVGTLIFVPIFKTVTHLPPFMGMLFGLGVMWVVTEIIHSRKDEAEKGILSVNHVIRKIDTPSILFFLGILLAVSALQSTQILARFAAWVDLAIGDTMVIGLLVGLFSAVIDNVPIVAAVQGMYTLAEHPTDDFFWQLVTYCAGTGGSALIVGSAAGVAAMGLERIDFLWYLKKISPLAIAGYLAGAATYAVVQTTLHYL
jgi:Na+/H+ antiporter NhaD/arsenite permease-like protein